MRYYRWILVALLGLLLVSVSIFFLLKACGITFVTGPRKIFASDDVIWLLPPVENSRVQDGNGFVYEGDSVSASEKGGILQVNGKFYGTLKIGDSVDLSTKGVVLVNGQPRDPR